jgi:hypothetical protein
MLSRPESLGSMLSRPESIGAGLLVSMLGAVVAPGVLHAASAAIMAMASRVRFSMFFLR